MASVRFNRPTLDDLCDDLARFDESRVEQVPAGPVLPFHENIRFETVGFRYRGASSFALQNLSLTVQCNETVGLVGASGSGKTTLVDLLLGLYEPSEGRITVDGRPLDAETIPRWRQQIGYVPQHIFLSDDTLAHNIAFGIPPRDVDRARVEHAARIANLHGFIETLPEGYDTIVGERGVRLSGGQRQRIGIARALYHDPSVIVLDEATSALDGVTEDAVMEAIHDLAGRKTIIVIAHRVTTVQGSNRIFLIEEGRVVDEGTFADLSERNPTFRAMAKLQHSAEMV